MLSRLAGRTAKQLQGRWRRLEELDFVNTGKRPLERKRKKVKGAVKRTREESESGGESEDEGRRIFVDEKTKGRAEAIAADIILKMGSGSISPAKPKPKPAPTTATPTPTPTPKATIVAKHVLTAIAKGERAKRASFVKDENTRDESREMATYTMATSTTKLTHSLNSFDSIRFIRFALA